MKLHKLNVMLAAALLTTSFQASADSCQSIFSIELAKPIHQKELHTRDKAKTEIPQAQDGAKASTALYDYLKKSTSNLLERDYLADIFFLSMLTKEHVLLLGPPGTAKSLISRTILPNIKDKTTNESSFWKIQMNSDTNSGDTLGKEHPGQLLKGKFIRLWEQGILAFKTAFIDEIFDAPPRAERNILEAINERTSTSGAETYQGKLEFAIAATNSYLSEVFERAARINKPEGPRALLDRFAFKAYVPEEFLHLKSDISLIMGGEVSSKVDHIYFEDIYAARELMQQVKMPEHVAYFLSALTLRIHETEQILEQKSVNDYNKKRMEGKVDLEPPYRRTTYLSKRTLSKVKKILQAQVLLDYVKTGGTRALEVSLADVKHLDVYYGLKGPGSIEQVEGLYDRAVSPHERSQLSTIINESRVFETTYHELLSDYNNKMVDLAYSEKVVAIENLTQLTGDKKSKAAQEIAKAIIKVYPKILEIENAASWEVNGESVALQQFNAILTDKLKSVIGEEGFEQVLAPAREAMKKQAENLLRAEEEEREKQLLIERELELKVHKARELVESMKEHYSEETAKLVQVDSFDSDFSPSVSQGVYRKEGKIFFLDESGFMLIASDGNNKRRVASLLDYIETDSESGVSLHGLHNSERIVIVDNNEILTLDRNSLKPVHRKNKVIAKKSINYPQIHQKSTDLIYLLTSIQSDSTLVFKKYDPNTNEYESVKVSIPEALKSEIKDWASLNLGLDSILFAENSKDPNKIFMGFTKYSQAKIFEVDLEKNTLELGYSKEDDSLLNLTANGSIVAFTLESKAIGSYDFVTKDTHFLPDLFEHKHIGIVFGRVETELVVFDSDSHMSVVSVLDPSQIVDVKLNLSLTQGSLIFKEDSHVEKVSDKEFVFYSNGKVYELKLNPIEESEE